MLYPLLFEARFKERVWGGRTLEQLFGKRLPAGRTIGESWEVADRPGDSSVVRNGPLAGKDLRWLMETHAAELLGFTPREGARFPLLLKLLDARDDLSLQVHPPGHLAADMGGEPKTEMWYVAAADPGSKLYVGLRRGVTKAEFEAKVRDGSVAECFHQVQVQAGDAMFLPSGRVHALGKGLVIFEIQQNSDTTYRVFDWHRLGLDGKPRELHIEQSLRSIDFDDFEPSLLPQSFTPAPYGKVRKLVDDPLFSVDIHALEEGGHRTLPMEMSIVACTEGQVSVLSREGQADLAPGDFCLVPAGLPNAAMLSARSGATCLEIHMGHHG